jgi:hypothetical protein
LLQKSLEELAVATPALGSELVGCKIGAGSVMLGIGMAAIGPIVGIRGPASLAILQILVAAALKISISDGNVGTTVIDVIPVMHFPRVSEIVRSLSAVAAAAA